MSKRSSKKAADEVQISDDGIEIKMVPRTWLLQAMVFPLIFFFT